jgi:hypothetical protein
MTWVRNASWLSHKIDRKSGAWFFFATSSGAGAAWRLGSMFQKAPNSIWWCFSSFLLWWILGPACDAGCEVASLIQLNRLLMCIVRMCNLAVGSLRPLEIDLKGFRTKQSWRPYKVTTCSVQLDISDHWITGIALVQMQELTRLHTVIISHWCSKLRGVTLISYLYASYLVKKENIIWCWTSPNITLGRM